MSYQPHEDFKDILYQVDCDEGILTGEAYEDLIIVLKRMTSYSLMLEERIYQLEKGD